MLGRTVGNCVNSPPSLFPLQHCRIFDIDTYLNKSLAKVVRAYADNIPSLRLSTDQVWKRGVGCRLGAIREKE